MNSNESILSQNDIDALIASLAGGDSAKPESGDDIVAGEVALESSGGECGG